MYKIYFIRIFLSKFAAQNARMLFFTKISKINNSRTTMFKGAPLTVIPYELKRVLWI